MDAQSQLTGQQRLEKSRERKRSLRSERNRRFTEKKKKPNKEKRSDLTSQDEVAELAEAVFDGLREAITRTKSQRNNDARTAINIGISMLCGETLVKKNLQSQLAATLGINRRRIAICLQHRRNVLGNQEIFTPWTLIERKTRNDATPEAHRKLAYEFWQSQGISRQTGNKRDVSRKRVGPKDYVMHEKQILEKTQTEVYREFKALYPTVQMGQRYFESCKPFYVIPARLKDRNSCCCRYHVEIHMVFQRCMEYRRRHPKNGVKVYSHLSDLISDTLCPSENENDDEHYKCMNRNCKNCGTNQLTLLPEEKEEDPTAETVDWQRFEYVSMANDQRKLQIVTKRSSVYEMFQYFLSLLVTFPAHQFRAKWQTKQMKGLLDNLPERHVCLVHDYSENYTCSHQDQIQSLYYGQTQVSIHVTIVHRHTVDDDDDEDPASIITEHFFVISPDLGHDSHSVHKNRELVVKYLKDIGCEVEVIHEFTDGCSTQYKSRHCMGDICKSKVDFGITTIRNFFETSHAKGPQDGAGANLKYKCDMAVIKRQVLIQNAKDLYEFANKELQNPAPSRYQSENVRLKRRHFFYVEEVDRNRPMRLFNEVRGNRQIHSILGSCPNGSVLKTRPLSCYCDACLQSKYSDCKNKNIVGDWKEEHMTTERSAGDQRVTRSAFEEQNLCISDLVCNDSVVAIASGDAGEDYYLLFVTGNAPEILEKSAKDQWGCSFPVGAKVLRGLFLDKCGKVNENGEQQYKLIQGKEALVYAATVRYICQELTLHDGQCVVTTKTNEDILGSLNGF